MPSSLSGLRDFRLLWASGLFASLGGQMSALALPLLVLRQSGSAVQAGVVGTVSVASLLLTMLPGGALADSVERRRLMRWCNIGSFVAVAALAAAVLDGQAPLALVLMVAGAAAVISGFYGPAALGLLRAVVPEHLLGAASSRLQSRTAVARLLGPFGGGALFGLHPAAPFLIEALLLLLSATCLALMRTRSMPAPDFGRTFSRQRLVAGVAFLWHRTYLRIVLLVFGVGMNSAFSAMMFAALAIGSDGGHSGVSGGFVVTLSAAGSLVGALLASRLRPDERPAMYIAATCWTLAGAAGVLTVAHQPLTIGLLIAICTAVAAIANVGFLTLLLLATPEEMVGRVQSAAGLLSSLAQPIGPVAAGALLVSGGAGLTFAVLGVIYTLGAVVLTSALPARQRATANHPVLGASAPANAVIADRKSH